MYRIGRKLKNIRNLREMNQEDFGALFGMSRPTYSKYEKDKEVVDDALLYMMSKALGVSKDDLLSGEMNEKPTSVRELETTGYSEVEALREIVSLQRQLADCKKEVDLLRSMGSSLPIKKTHPHEASSELKGE